ncbi:hypothetical protein HK096_006356 [Nowakowskiella sp. JEL0078]|nr:hypothetical protein HK096_006356 [Nowakowskiella sp. JEL0078]
MPKKNLSTFALLWQLRGSVIPKTLSPIIFFSIWTTFIILLDKHYNLDLAINDQLATILSIVVGLLLVFRTDTAYNRFWDGRNLWSTLTTDLGNIATNIDKTRKVIALKHCIAFAYAVKHHLRSEYGIHYPDYHNILPKITNSAGLGIIGDDDSTYVEAADVTSSESQPLLRIKESKEASAPPVSLPIILMGHLTNFVAAMKKDGKLGDEDGSTLFGNIEDLADTFTTLELNGNTPLPLAYSVHMAQTLTLYCLFLPFQLVDDLAWIALPVMIMAVFTFKISLSFGIDAIGEEISNPFGYDTNDLPIDSYCEELKNEIEGYIFSNPPEVTEKDEWILASFETERKSYKKRIGEIEVKRYGYVTV